MTDTSKQAIAAVVERLRYAVGNPSAWDSFDDEKSELIREAASLISALEAERDKARQKALTQHGRAETYLNAALGWQRRAEAAEARITTLQAKLEKAAEALEPFANLAKDYVEHGMDDDDQPMAGRIKMAQPVGPFVKFSDFHRAASTLSTLREAGNGTD